MARVRTILLETNRLLLRRFTADDGDYLYALDNDPQVMRFINGGAPTPRRVIVEQILPRFCTYDEQQPGCGFWAAEEQAGGRFVGWFSLRPAAEVGTAVIGYRLCRAAWGQGYATEGVRALIAKAFAEMDIRRVVATTYEENLASRRVMEKAGLRLVRRFRFTPDDLAAADTFHSDAVELWDGDDLEYALDKEDWLANSAEDDTGGADVEQFCKLLPKKTVEQFCKLLPFRVLFIQQEK